MVLYPLPHRNLEKGEAEKTVNAIWQSKREFERAHGVTVPLQDYLYVFLHRKFAPGVKAITESAYNLLYTLSKHTYDPDCCIFLKVREPCAGSWCTTKRARLGGEGSRF